MNRIKRILKIGIISYLLISACSPLNPVNDFFGIRMNVDEEKNFKIVSYNDIDGITYQNSVNMDPKINAWAEISPNEVTIKVVNNSDVPIPLNYTSDQFILITNEKEYDLLKGEREEYLKKISIEPNASQTFILELPIDYSSVAQNPTSESAELLNRRVIRDFTKTGKKLNVTKDNIKFVVVKLGDISILLKPVPENK
jgi:hypothetical protein